MRIIDMMARCGQFISYEFFPPKEKDKWPQFFEVVERLKATRPLFVSVTYGAGGSTRDNTLEIVGRMKRDLELEPMAHLTCVGASEEYIHSFMQGLKDLDVDNVLALRGDPPKGDTEWKPDSETFQYASDLVTFTRTHYPDMGVGVAGYPEKHPQAESLDQDCTYLKAKLDAGADFAITQLFFDNQAYFDFVALAKSKGITKPIIPGILPILSLASVKRIVSLSGNDLPPELDAMLTEADAKGGPEAVRKIGIQHAIYQVHDLLEKGAPGVHLYSLNQADACLEIVQDTSICKRLAACKA